MKTIHSSFIGGEVSLDFSLKSDYEKTRVGLIKSLNMIPQPSGILKKRAGTEFIDHIQQESEVYVLHRYFFNNEESVLMMFGDKTLQIISSKGLFQKANSNKPLIVPTPWPADVLKELSVSQSSKGVMVCHQDFPIYEIRRKGSHDFEIEQFHPNKSVGKPYITNTDFLNTEPDLASRRYYYAVTAVAENGQESDLSDEAVLNNQMLNTGSYNRIEWSEVEGVIAYNVYRKVGGTYALVGSTLPSQRWFEDFNYAADSTKTPAKKEVGLFESVNNFPRFTSVIQGRRVFASTRNSPHTLWFSRSGNEYDFTSTDILASDERVKIDIISNHMSKINNVVATNKVIVMTSDAEWSISGDPITPKSISAQVQSSVGSSTATPCIVNSSVLFASNAGSRLFEMGYNWQAGGFISGDISIAADHLFQGKVISRIEYTKYPERIIWVLFSDGTMAGCSYVPEQQILAWFRLEFSCPVIDICELTENGVSSLFMVMKRKKGVFIEKLDSSAKVSLDCYFEYSGKKVSKISGLFMHDGETCIVANGAEMEEAVNKDGTVEVKGCFDKAYIGIKVNAEVQTIPIPLNQEDLGVSEPRNFHSIYTISREFAKAQVTMPYTSTKLFLKKGTDDLPNITEFKIHAKWKPVQGINIKINSPYRFKLNAIGLKYTEGRGNY